MGDIVHEIDDLVAAWARERGFAVSTLRTYRSVLLRLGRFAAARGRGSLDDLLEQDVHAFLAMRKSELQPYTFATQTTICRSFLHAAWARDVLPHDLSLAVPSPVRPRVLRAGVGEAARVALLQHVATLDGPQGAYVRAVVGLAVCCGLRRDEICSLAVRDLDPEHGWVTVVASKEGRTRTVPMHTSVAGWLASYLLHKDLGPEDTVFGAHARQPMARTRVAEAVRRAGDAVGLTNLTPHALRHTYATWLYHEGEPLEVIASLLGHRSVEQTMAYLDNDTSVRIGDRFPAADVVARRYGDVGDD